MLSRASLSCVRLAAVIGCLSAASTALAGPDWVERGDAGSTIFTAQAPLRPAGAFFLDTISGSLASGVLGDDFEDLYFFSVVEPAEFSVELAFADFDASLFLFDLTVNNEIYGRLANDNATGETNLPRLLSAASDGTGVLITQPGDYLIAVAGAGRSPLSRTGPIFSFESPLEISGPDGPGGLNPLDSWAGDGLHGNYRITFTSADFPMAPAPGPAVLGLLGIACAIVRRRR